MLRLPIAMARGRSKPERPTDPICKVGDAEDLNAILDTEIDAVIWRRQPPEAVLAMLDAVPRRAMENARFYVPVGDVEDRVLDLQRRWDVAADAEMGWFAKDIQNLANRFAQILEVTRTLVRIEWVHDDACRKFHRDVVKARMICAYRGPGTEFGLARDRHVPTHTETAPTGSVILLKGKLWPVSPKRLVVHRSPPIIGTGVSRLLVVINETPPGIDGGVASI